MSPPTRVIAIGASAGGVGALQRIVGALPEELPAAVCIVLHIPATGKSLLAPILDRSGPLPAETAVHGAPLEAGHIYVAPADLHLLVRGDRLELDPGPKENGVRPAVDPLFRSLAAEHGSAGVAVVLSGALDDGASGVVSVKEAGGTVVVQAPDDALVPSMPEAALAAVDDPVIAPVDGLADLLVSLADQPAPEEAVMPTPERDPLAVEINRHRPAGPPCPECSGALWELREGQLVRHRCRVGHTYSDGAFVDHGAGSIEAALWAERFREGACDALERAELIRRAPALGGATADEAEEASAG